LWLRALELRSPNRTAVHSTSRVRTIWPRTASGTYWARRRNWSRAKVEGYSERKLEVHGWPVNLTSFQLGPLFHAKADNVSPGANLARTTGATREEAEQLALTRAGELLSRTQRRAV